MTREQIIAELPKLILLPAGAEGVFDFILEQIDKKLSEIHFRSGIPGPAGGILHPSCQECFHNWPCPTVRTLEALKPKPKAIPMAQEPTGYAAMWAEYAARMQGAGAAPV